MKELVKIFNELKNDSSRTGKEVILKKYKDNEVFREVLRFVYNPFIVTGISTKKINKKLKLSKSLLLEIGDIVGMMNYLKMHNSGRDYDIENINLFLQLLETKEEKELVKEIVTKSLKVGITEKTINKVYGEGEIPSFSVMLAEKWEEKGDALKGLFYVTKKIDGNRCVCIVGDDSVKFFTRKGQPIEGMDELGCEFEKLPKGFVYDGELLSVNKKDLATEDLFRDTQKNVRKKGKKEYLEFHIFDIIPIDEFKKGKSKLTYDKRRNILETIEMHIVSMGVKNIHVLPVLYHGEDKQRVVELMIYAEEQGWEGVMVNKADAYYQNKRTADILKVKQFKSGDLLVVSVVKAIDGEFKGLMRRVNVEYKGSIVGVGSGFSVEQRKEFIENPDEIIGKIIEVRYHKESRDEDGNLSLRFPSFKCIRYDKGIEDIRYE